MRFDTVVFDLDGTLIDTLEDLKDSMNYALSTEGFPPRTYEEIRTFVGNGLRRLVHLSIPEGTDNKTEERCFQTLKEYYLTHSMVKTAPYKGIPETIRKLSAEGVKLSIVTNKAQEAAEQIVKSFFGDDISVVVGQVDGLPQKPQPEGVWLAMEKLGADKDKTVYIGDSEVDCLTAKNSNLPIIGCVWGFRGRETLEENNADFIAESPEEIIRLVKGE